MDERQTPFFCGGVLFFLLTEFAFDGPAPRERYNRVKDDHSDPILMTDLIYAFSGSENYGSAKDTSNYKECKFEGGVNIPFNQVRLCADYDQEVRERYGEALKRMDEFVGWHLDPGAKDWFVKAVLDIIENDSSIKEDTSLYIQPDGIASTKAAIRKETDYDLPAFLVGVLHFITTQRREQNGYGIPTLDTFTEKKNRKPRKYNGHLGESITRTVNVDFLPTRKKAVAEVHTDPAPVLEPGDVIERTDDEVINGAMMRTAQAAATALGAVPQPKINAAALGDAIAPLLVAAEACKPNEEVLAKGISTIAAAFEAQKHAMAEQIRRNSRQEGSASGTEIPDTDEHQADDAAQEGTKTTVIQRQTNVIQNGENNVNVTNNGTINFNF